MLMCPQNFRHLFRFPTHGLVLCSMMSLDFITPCFLVVYYVVGIDILHNSDFPG